MKSAWNGGSTQWRGTPKAPRTVAGGAAAQGIALQYDDFGAGLGEEVGAGRADDSSAYDYDVGFVRQFGLLVSCGLIFLYLIPALFHHLIAPDPPRANPDCRDTLKV